jgi:sugar phosphate permease
LRFLPRNIFYGWYIVAATLVALSLGSGFTFWSFTVYIPSLEDEFGWSRGELSLAYSLGLIVSGLTAPFAGRVVDRIGARRVIAVGAIGVCTTFTLLSLVQELWQYYAVYALQSLIQSWSFFLPFQWLLAQWFVRRRGTALGIATAGFGVGGSVVFPLIALAIETVGWRGAYLLSGFTILAVFVPFTLFLIRDRPSEMGLLPDGATEDTPEGQRHAFGSAYDWSLREALRSHLFWMLALPMALFFGGLISFGVHSVPFFEDEGFSTGTAAIFLAAASVFRTFGRVVAGYVIDRVENLVVVAVPMMLLHAAVIVVLIFSTEPWAIAFFIVAWGIGGSFGPILTPILVGRTFGMRSYGAIFGALIFIETFSDVAMPVVGGFIFDATGSYTIPFTIYATMFAASAVAYLAFFAASAAHGRLGPRVVAPASAGSEVV